MSFSFPLSLLGSISLSHNLVNWRRFVEIGNHGNVDIVAVPKRFVVSAYSYMVGYLCIPEGAWLGSISNFVYCLPQSFNHGPYKDLVRIFPWLQKTDIVIGYMPIHPDDLDRMWQNRLCLRRSATCRPYATR